LNYALALASGLFLVLIFPRFNLTWLAPVALAPLLVAVMREVSLRRRFLLGYLTGLVYWFGVNYWIQFVLSYHGGTGDIAGWGLFILFCLAKAIQMGIFGLIAGAFMSRWWAVPAGRCRGARRPCRRRGPRRVPARPRPARGWPAPSWPS